MLTHLEREDGYTVRLIEGVEEDPYLLGSSLDRQVGACVVIVCLSDALGPSQFRRIEGVYNARKGPEHHLDTIFVEPDETPAMAESVRGVVANAQTKLTSKPKPKPKPKPADPAASSSAHRMRDVVGVTTLSAVGTDTIPSPNAAMAAVEAPLGLARPAPITPTNESSAAMSQAALSQAALSQATLSQAALSQAALSQAAQSQTAQSQTAQSQTAQSQTAQSQTAQSQTAPASLSQSMSGASSQLMFEAKERKNPAWVAPVLFLIFLAVAGTVMLLLLLQQQQHDDAALPRGAPVLNQDAPDEGADKASEGSKEATAKADESPGENQGARATSDSETGDSETGDSETGDSETGGNDSGGNGSADTPSNEAAQIVEAIESGEMRAVDLILIANTSELSAWRDAANRCRSKSVNGVRDWRLPTLKELKTIRKARMVERDRYWSSTLATQVGSGTDHVYVLDLAEHSIEPMSKEASDVRVICVRASRSVE